MKDKVEGEPDDAELFGLLADWADENNKILPFNKGFLVYQFKKVLSNG